MRHRTGKATELMSLFSAHQFVTPLFFAGRSISAAAHASFIIQCGKQRAGLTVRF